MNKYLLSLLFVSSLASAENTTPAPDWYFDTAMGMSNAIAATTIGIVDNSVGDKADSWTREQAVDEDGAAFIGGQAAGSAGVLLGGGEVFAIFKVGSKVKKLETANEAQKAANEAQKAVNEAQKAANEAQKAELDKTNALLNDVANLQALQGLKEMIK